MCFKYSFISLPHSLIKKWDFFKNQILLIFSLNSVGSELKDFTTWSIKLNRGMIFARDLWSKPNFFLSSMMRVLKLYVTGWKSENNSDTSFIIWCHAYSSEAFGFKWYYWKLTRLWAFNWIYQFSGDQNCCVCLEACSRDFSPQH